jgi:hypothetical protein
MYDTPHHDAVHVKVQEVPSNEEIAARIKSFNEIPESLQHARFVEVELSAFSIAPERTAVDYLIIVLDDYANTDDPSVFRVESKFSVLFLGTAFQLLPKRMIGSIRWNSFTVEENPFGHCALPLSIPLKIAFVA